MLKQIESLKDDIYFGSIDPTDAIWNAELDLSDNPCTFLLELLKWFTC